MKKAKVILTAVTVLAVVSGALAFKAQKLNGDLSCAPSGQACLRNTQGLITYTTVDITDPDGQTLVCTAAGVDDCQHGQSKFVIQDN
jgi:hypothetical protein